MSKKTIAAIGIIGGIALLLIGTRMMRAARNESLQETRSNITPVRGFVLKPEPFTRRIEESGTLEGDKESVIAAETGGRILEVFVNVGDVVKAGAPLIRLDDELLKLESDRAKIAYDKVKLDFERIETLYAQKSVSESDLENARLGMKGAEVQYRLALKTYNDGTVRAPFSGTIATRMVQVGQMLERGMPVVQLVDLSSLKLTVQVSEGDVQYVSVGSPANVIVEASGDTVAGTVHTVGSRAATGSRMFPVEVTIPGRTNLRSGMYARAIISANSTRDGLLVPRAAILPDMGRSIVFLAKGNAASKVTVRTIGVSGDRVAVEGISAGDTVIVTGNQMLAQGSPIALTLSNGDGHDSD